ncbi:MAG: hypothetical protein U0271_28375 [Polyangiaceae bacterium]
MDHLLTALFSLAVSARATEASDDDWSADVASTAASTLEASQVVGVQIAPPALPLVPVARVAQPVLDWTSPVFVWFDEGYAYAEVTFGF